MRNFILNRRDKNINENVIKPRVSKVRFYSILSLSLVVIMSVYFKNVMTTSKVEDTVAVIDSSIIEEQIPIISVKEDIDTSNVKDSVKYVELQYRNKTFKVIDKEVYNICKNKSSIPCKISITKNVDDTEDYELIAIKDFILPKNK